MTIDSLFLCVTFDLWTHLSELFKGELVAGLSQLLDDLSDPVARQRQVSGLEKLGELILANKPIVVHIWKRDGKVRGQTESITLILFNIVFIQETCESFTEYAFKPGSSFIDRKCDFFLVLKG